ncbi:hypothetical protein FBU30_007518 [Linnemannia zychae]|nr:hypothetical protein FBU30_007518 [Linnemannia zychae]
MSETHTTSTTRPPSSQTGEPIYPPLMSGQVAYPVMAAVAGTTIILLLLAAFVSYQVRAIIRQIESGARRKQRRNQRTYWWSKFIDHIQTQVHESPNPHGIDSPMVQPDDAVRGPEGIVYPLPPGHSDVSQSYPTSVATTRGSSNRASSASWEVGRGNEIKVEMEESRLAEYSTLVDRIEKINEHYERQFRIVETEILQGTSDYINDEARRNSSTLQE